MDRKKDQDMLPVLMPKRDAFGWLKRERDSMSMSSVGTEEVIYYNLSMRSSPT